MKRLLVLIITLILIFSFTACSNPSSELNEPTEPSTPSEPSEPNEPSEPSEPSETGGGNETHTIGLANINERGVFGKLVKQGFEQACEARGWNLEYVDNNADGQTAVSNAELLALKQVEFVVNLNVDASVGQTIMDIFNEADIPVLAVDIALPGAPFFGIDSGEMGYFNGEFAAGYIKENFDGEIDYVVLITQIASGDEVQKRVRNAAVALDDNGIKYKEVVEIEGENDAAITQKRFNDFLTAHPDAERIAVFTINENTAQGAYAAAVTANREWDIRVFSANCGSQFVEPMYENEGNQSWVSTVSNFTELYGEQCLGLIEQYFETGSIPDNSVCKMEVITWENIKEYYPLDNLPWAGMQ
ncbi:MAG: sugar ABC transporter substrate-binding protein [Caldicoprobacterales bacterium]|jgi:ribose transport system substrate-binding protein|nr:sugar ABC transporter substrate-binding protein [Clostridiales bacterium]